MSDEVLSKLRGAECKKLILDNYQLEYIEICPLPCVDKTANNDIEPADVKAELEKGKAECISIIYSDDYEGDTKMVGKVLVKEKWIYFIILDTPGWSGYDCCGCIKLDYCFSLVELLQFGMTDYEKELVLNPVHKKSEPVKCFFSGKPVSGERLQAFQTTF